MSDQFTMSVILPVESERLYRAWLSSEAHAAFTGSVAKITARKGGHFTAWDGYITGKTLELEPFRRIVQAWRTTDFPEDADDSLLEIVVDRLDCGSKQTLNHSNLPAGRGEEFKQGWEEYYFKPMKAYFAQGQEPA
jgi:activator of HSP90 ATPase